MKNRGKILRDTNAGPGLLSIALEQYPFTLEQNWKSDVPPRVGMVVDVELDAGGAVLTAAPVADAQVAKEQADKAMRAAKEKGGALAAGLTARFGLPTLVALGALFVGWFFLNTISIQVSQQYGIGMSFWKVLAAVNSPAGMMAGLQGADGGTGLYGFLCIVALVAPLASYFWHDRRAHLGGLLPLAFMAFVAFMIYKGVGDAMKQAQGMAGELGGGAMMESMSREMLATAWRSISIGGGVYLAIAAGLFLAGKAIIKFLVAKA